LALALFFKIKSLSKPNQNADAGKFDADKFDADSFRHFEEPIGESIVHNSLMRTYKN
jgi:hypothetical protein